MTVTTPPMTQATTEPAAPSQDFLGLIEGAMGCLPVSTPTANPPMSLHTVTMMNTATRLAPSGAASRRLENDASIGT